MNAPKWEKGDRFRLTIEGTVQDIRYANAVEVLFDDGGGANNVSEAVMAKAERIEPPYVPQVGDIVRHCTGTVGVVDEIIGDSVGVDCGEQWATDRVGLIVRKGEVYR